MEIENLLARLEHDVSAVCPPGPLEETLWPRAALLLSLSSLLGRVREGNDAPVKLAVFGPTGAGKSKVFNSLLGAAVSPSGIRRPFTTRAVYAIARGGRRPTEDAAHPVRVVERDGPVAGLEGLVLIDTPDFDSVDRQNRLEADRMLTEADAFLFVTDPEKYADQSTWAYLDRIRALGKRTLVVLNKVVDGGCVEDLRRRLKSSRPSPLALPRASGQPAPRSEVGARAPAEAREVVGGDALALPERAVGDESLLPPEDLAPLRHGLARLVATGGERARLRRDAFRGDLARLLELWESSRSALEDALEASARLKERLTERRRALAQEIARESVAPVDEGVKREVYRRVLEQIQRVDILRYPRRLLALPWEGLKTLLKRWLPGRKDSRGPAAGGLPADRALQALERCLLRLHEETIADFNAERALPGLVDRELQASLRADRAELLERLARVEERYRDWLRQHAEAAVASVTLEHKAKFILSQVIYNAAIVGIQIHTAGQFTLLELATDGVLSPVVAKAAGMAVSSERVRSFEAAARAEHQRGLESILDEASSRLGARLTAWSEFGPQLRKASEGFERLEEAAAGWLGAAVS